MMNHQDRGGHIGYCSDQHSSWESARFWAYWTYNVCTEDMVGDAKGTKNEELWKDQGELELRTSRGGIRMVQN